MANNDPADGGQELVHQGPPLVSPEPLEPDDAVEQREEEDGGQQRKDEAEDLREVVLQEGGAKVGVGSLVHLWS